MVLTNTALADILDASLDRLQTNITNVEVSTSSTTPLVTDTAQGGTTLNETAFSTSRTATGVTAAIFLDVTEFNSNTINKAGTKDSGGNLYSSALTNAIVKTSSVESFIEIGIDLEVTNS